MYNYFRDPKGGSLGLPRVLTISEAADSARKHYIDYLKTSWPKGTGGLQKVDAQSRIAASYGLFQTLYSLALRRGYVEDVEHIPEGLNVPEINFSLSVEYQAYLMQVALGYLFAIGNAWPSGYEESFRTLLYPQWNESASYPDDVIRESAHYPPKN